MSTINFNGQEIDLDPEALAALVKSLPVDQLHALKDAATSAQADLIEQLRKELAPMLSGPVQQLVEGGYVRPSQTSARVGAYVYGIAVTIDDRAYEVTVSVKDTAASKEREHLFPKKSAKK